MIPKLRGTLRYCIADDRAIFMDLSTGRYFCLDHAPDAAFRHLAESGFVRPGDASVIRGLFEQGLLEPGSGEWLTDWPAPPRSQVCEPSSDVTGKAPGHMVAMAILAHLRARYWLWRWPIKTIVAKLETRALNDATRQGRAPITLRDLAAAFRKTDMLFPPFEQCLPRSLAFFLLCNAFGLRPSLVIGVRSRPFAAHAWVEDDRSVIMDDLDAAANFTPILRI
jgi:hypothetical protein